MDDIRRWFLEQITAGRAAQPSPSGFPLASTLVAPEDAPPEVRESRDFYGAACFDFGAGWIHRQPISDREVLYVHVGTDGDRGALEIFEANGSYRDAAFLDGQLIIWEDRALVRARFAVEDE